MHSKLFHDIRFMAVASCILLFTSVSVVAAETRTFEAEKAARIGGASMIADRGASGKFTVALSKSGDGVKFTKLPAATKLAIHYASTNVGTISVAVNDQIGRASCRERV